MARRRSPAYDSQREELYRMENEGLPGLSRSKFSRADHATLLKKMAQQFDIEAPTLRWVAHEKFSGLWIDHRIELSTNPHRSGRSPMTLIHEFSHHVMAQWDEEDVLEGHGPEFASVYGDCLAMAGLIPWHGWQELCKQYGVKCLDTRAIRTISGLRRVIKKRAAEAALKSSPTTLS